MKRVSSAEGIRDSVLPKNKLEGQRESIQDGSKTSNEAQEKKLDVAEIRMSGVTKMDRSRNERIRGTTKVGEISKKVQES